MKNRKVGLLSTLIVSVALCLGMGIVLLTFSVDAQVQTVENPILSTISEAIKPGDTVTITGHNLTVDSAFQIAYAPNVGVAPTVFNEDVPPVNCKYLQDDDLLTSDSQNGLMFIFPESESPGTYDFWVKTASGWSNGITLNGIRPLYCSQEATYEGLPIEIVGRNFFQSEYGVGTDQTSRTALRVRLVKADNSSIAYTIPVANGIRYTADNSATGNIIYESNPYKITFITPDVEGNYGEYRIFVSADGMDFRETEIAQTFEIVEKEAQNWDTTVFGEISSTHIGNDPLDLQVYWAQDLNYTNIDTIASNATQALADMNTQIDTWKSNGTSGDVVLGGVNAIKNTSDSIVSKVQALSNEGGGVLYFPAGDYYVRGLNFGNTINNVLFVGDKNGGTNIHFVNSRTSTEYLIQMGGTELADGVSSGSNNIGFARLNFDRYTIEQPAPDKFTVYMADPDMVIHCGPDQGSLGNYNIADYISENKFVSDCNFNFNFQKEGNTRASLNIGGEKNVLMQNINFTGGASLQWGKSYKYQTIRNSIVNCTGVASCTIIGLAHYTIVENVYGDNNYDGHGIKIGAYSYIGDCYIQKTGLRGANANNKGEPIIIESTNRNFLAVGSVRAATETSFTFVKQAGLDISTATQVDSGDISVYVVSGKGIGQMRKLNYNPLNNVFQFADGEKPWDVIPDSTSKVTIVAPSVSNTIYATTVKDTLKPIFLYTDNFDTIVANCTTIDSEGIALVAVSRPSVGRFVGNAGIRIENNTLIGTSPVTGHGGIYTQIDRTQEGYFGVEMWNISIRNNTLQDIYPGVEPDWGFLPNVSETANLSGIIIGSTGSSQDDAGTRFITIEDNVVDGCHQYGIRCSDGILGLVIKDNEISNIANADKISISNEDTATVMGYHTLYVDGEVSSLSGTYRKGTILPAASDSVEKRFIGWSVSQNYHQGELLITEAQETNIVLYAIYEDIEKAQFVSRNAILTEEIAFIQYLTLREDYSEPLMSYTINGKKQEIIGVKSGERYKFSVLIAPQLMSSSFKVSVTALRNGETRENVLSDINLGCFSDYCKLLLNTEEYFQYHRLIVDLLNYGAEAQKYVNINIARLFFDNKIGSFGQTVINRNNVNTVDFNEIMPYDNNTASTIVIQDYNGLNACGELTYSINSFIKNNLSNLLYQALWCYGQSAVSVKWNGGFYGNERDVF